MTSRRNRDIEFLSNPELISILRSILDELDVVADSGAYRSTTYLAVSAIEGLFGEIMKLLGMQPGSIPAWPVDKNKPKALNKLTLEDRENILKAAGALPQDFENLYGPVRGFRNYMHPERELKERTPIARSVGELAVACLDALIEKYGPQRFVANQTWQLMHGLAQVPTDNVIQMPQNPGDNVSLLISELSARSFREMTFRVMIPPHAIFNFVYNYHSLDQFMAARVEGREGENGRGHANGKVVCTKWLKWSIGDSYTSGSEPSPKQRMHEVQVVFDPPGPFTVTVDQVQLALDGGASWEFDPDGKVGFMTECGMVSVTDLEVHT